MGTPYQHQLQKPEEMMDAAHPLPQPNADSFMALLELPPSEAMELLLPSGSSAPGKPFIHSLVKDEVAADSDCSNPNPLRSRPSAVLGGDAAAEAAAPGCKRKEADRKGKGSAKKKKGDCTPEGQVLPYVHVRARRGQATDSHSLAERARREKINARMKLLQELVPGCNKISGTALVLDEIINHVQSLQRQVEVLSMKLAAVNSWIDFDIDGLIYPGHGAVMDGNFVNMLMPTICLPELQLSGNNEEHFQQWPLDSIHQPVLPKGESHSIYTPEVSPLSSNSSAD
ncbi:hypothetical protein MLD38_033184 [Melastoma candidum]|uniref:Uncharacterized protein n=1 Tax=Melastoma candidum TaxID=119954 RepID=A0ACB9M5P4_9MYRT|nr:hypothetical protein MLD38_033184 [Melastoma candidum]